MVLPTNYIMHFIGSAPVVSYSRPHFVLELHLLDQLFSSIVEHLFSKTGFSKKAIDTIRDGLKQFDKNVTPESKKRIERFRDVFRGFEVVQLFQKCLGMSRYVFWIRG